MVSVNGLPPASVPGNQRTNKAKKAGKKNNVNQAQGKTPAEQTSKVADAVSHSIRQVQPSDVHQARLQYDLPEGKSRKAMEEYLNVMNQAKREELASLLGVDIYI
ncbi:MULTISPECIES: hypothetical protein [Vibrio]|uniref:Chromosome partitioning protein ParA n=1 Tax=Vibrio proteolyticus NBRC 13287 TaxID=1219065 RepID=U3BGY6_VIBPR|nr:MULTISPECIES: hypothetical protein [Vibrio]NAW58245.1 chromosome partitioning protein ParA [Vibrio sp. V36_P2S2PM302]NAX19876.1 chromosome partitioning protein ParA [Vibrio sp. V39_P1S14PM300]NAX23994.1 chromosome partitioning protein ParA [Vibrio sp. V38_P2S17PM301]NAX29767.1 chromosome partitioning protein ParA [Vibrio sp. V37_P2S8PM304]GAD65963.1 hypothetical protein VPR01S_02_02140 [Vibrio proteolyticus NBRC 13287]